MQPAALTDEERTVLEGVVRHQIKHPGREAPLDEIRLLFRAEEDAKAGNLARSLAERLLLIHRQERGFEWFAVTPEGLLTSHPGNEGRRIGQGILRLFQAGIQQQRSEFSSFTLGDLGLSTPEEHAVAQLVVRAFELHGHLPAVSTAPSGETKFFTPDDVVDFRGFSDIDDLVERVRRLRAKRRAFWSGSRPPATRETLLTEASRHRVTSETLSILFMDLAGWSQLTTPQITAYVTNAFPKLAGKIRSFSPMHCNTWGDAVVATFRSALDAANCALDVRDFFRRATETEGVPQGLVPRISLHLGEVIIAENPILNRPDVFGGAVHLAARLEPVTARGHVFCTEALADALRSAAGLAPVAHALGDVELPKGFGRVGVYAVTGPNEDAPPRLPDGPRVTTMSGGPPAAEVKPLGDDETEALLRVMVKGLPAKSVNMTYEQVMAKTHARVSRDAIRRILPRVLASTNFTGTAGEETLALEFHQPAPVVISRPPRRF